MLTYACVEKPEDIMRSIKRFECFNDARWDHDLTLVFEGEEIILIFDNRPLWQYYLKSSYKRNKFNHRFGRWIERRIRLMLKLRGLRVRLRAKQRRDTAPQKQSTSEARPAA